MVPWWWSVVLTVVGVGGLYLVTKKLIAGFVIGIAVQVLWTIYAVTTMQWGFIGSAVAYGLVNALGVHRWARDRREAAAEALRPPGVRSGQLLVRIPQVYEVPVAMLVVADSLTQADADMLQRQFAHLGGVVIRLSHREV